LGKNKISYNDLQIGGRFNAANVLLYAEFKPFFSEGIINYK